MKINFLESKPLVKRLASATFWSLLATVFLRGSSLISSILIARLLGQKSFGEFAMINSTIVALGNFAGFGLGITTTKYVAELRLSNPLRLGNVLGLCNIITIIIGAFFSFIIFVFSSTLASNFLNSPQLINALRLGCLLIFFNAIHEMQIGILSGFEAYKNLAKVNFFSSLINVLFPIIGAWLYDLNGAMFAMIFITFLNCLLCDFTLKNEYKKYNIKLIYSRLAFQEIKIIHKFTLPNFLNNILVAPVLWLGNTALAHQPNGYSEIAVFNAANQYRSLLLFLPLIIGRISLPIFSSVLSENKKKSTVKTFIITVLSSILIILPIASLMSIFSEQLMIVYGSEFGKYGSVLIVMLIGLSLNGITAPIGNLIIASGKIWLGFFMNLSWAILFLIFTWIFTQKNLGAFGLALSYTIAYTLHSVWVFFHGIKILRSL
ncbi:MAG: oligosaccharide flippase family protein [Calothrix sp. C42_A2020_038]|nr:oligosaccharide flippase family protein [Calothrix sp. C42_A2020_038]